MRVWIVNQYAIPLNRAGGTWHHTMARELGRRGHQVTIIAGSLDHLSGEQYGLDARRPWKRERVEDVDFFWLRVPSHRGNSFGRIWNIAVFTAHVWSGLGTEKLERPDVIIGTVPTPCGALAAQRLANKFGVPFLLDVRDLWPDQLAEVSKQTMRWVERLVTLPPMMKAMRWLEFYLYRKAEYVLTVIPRAAEHISKHGKELSRIAWLPQFVDLTLVPQPSPYHGSTSDTFTVMYAGTFGSYNNLDSVLTAAGILQQRGCATPVKFRLIGDGPEKSRLQARVFDEKLDLVCLEPPVPKSRIYATLQEADIFVAPTVLAPSQRYGVPFQKAIDYMASAKPTVIVTCEQANPVSDSQAGLLAQPGDPHALVNSILQLIATPLAERVAMGLRGRALVEKIHTSSKVADTLERVLLDLRTPIRGTV